MNKRRILSFAAAFLLLLCAAFAAGAEGVPLLEGHTFGETLGDYAQTDTVYQLDFRGAEYPVTTRRLADPVYDSSCWVFNGEESRVLYSFTAASFRTADIAGYRTDGAAKFYFTSADAAKTCSMEHTVFYAYQYTFTESDRDGIFDGVQKYLTGLYGEPEAQDTDPDAIWKKPAYDPDVGQEIGDRVYADNLALHTPRYASWKPGADGIQIVLVEYGYGGSYRGTELLILDTGADAAIEALYADPVSYVSDAVEGL